MTAVVDRPLTAVGRPNSTIPPRFYVCGRCGIIRQASHPAKCSGYCADCLPFARELGWVPRQTRKAPTDDSHPGCAEPRRNP